MELVEKKFPVGRRLENVCAMFVQSGRRNVRNTRVTVAALEGHARHAANVVRI